MFSPSIQGCVKLESWCKSIGVKHHEKLVIRSTESSGVGVFYTIDDPSVFNEKEYVELLRVPSTSTYNINTLKTMTMELEKEHSDIVKKCLNEYCQLNNISETTIIIGYLLGYSVLLKLNNDLSINQYLNVLFSTKVPNLNSDNKLLLDDFLSSFDGNSMITAIGLDLLDDKWEELQNWIINEFNVEIELSEILQLQAAVRSRTLEIPRSKESDQTDGDYYVDVTLVPVLDFVNHDNNKLNAFFDIDKSNNDILLMLDIGKLQKELLDEEFEIFISYSQSEDLNKFFVNYGFLPDSSNTGKVIEIPVFGYFKSDILDNETINSRLYYLRQSPNVQFYLEYQNGTISNINVIMEEYYSDFIFNEKIEWDKLLEHEENESNELCAEEFEVGFDRCYTIYESLNEKEFEANQQAFLAYLLEFFKNFKLKIEHFVEFINEYEFNEGETHNITSLLNLYRDISNYFINNKITLVIFKQNGYADWLPLRLMPIYNFKSSILDKEQIDIGELKLS